MKKFLKVLGILIAIFIIWICFSVVMNKFYKVEISSLDQTDKKMIEDLSVIYRNFKENGEELWSDDYKLNEKPILLIRTNKDKGMLRKYSYVINVKDIENSIFSKKIDISDSMDLPEVYRVSNFNFEVNKISTWGPDNFGEINIDGEKIFYFKYHPKMMENPDVYHDFSSFMLHESFHTYKQKSWRYDKNEGEYIENYPVNEENYALMGLGFRLLDKSMRNNDIDEVKEYLKEWTIVESYRYNKWPQLQNETNTEAIEGTARYIEAKYSELTGGKSPVLAKKQEPYYVTFIEAFTYIANNQAESPAYLERPMKYETGAAVGLLMDKVGIEWKNKIEDSESHPGKTQYQILVEYFNINKNDISEEVLDKIKKDNNYEELLNEGKKIVKLKNLQ